MRRALTWLLLILAGCATQASFNMETEEMPDAALIIERHRGEVWPLCVHDTGHVVLGGGATARLCRKCGQFVAFDWPERSTNMILWQEAVLGQKSPDQLQIKIFNIYRGTNQWLDYRALNIEVLTSHAPVLLGTNEHGEYRIRFCPN